MKKVIAIAAALALCGCSTWSSKIRHDLVDYTDTLETSTNQLLLVNVLQARDDVPLHFAAVPNIHGSLAGSVSIAATDAFPLGTEGHVIAGTRDRQLSRKLYDLCPDQARHTPWQMTSVSSAKNGDS